MYLCHKSMGDLVKVLDSMLLINPVRTRISGRLHSGKELQEPEHFPKTEFVFPSGEKLPRCW